jgi:hypothetical protein
VRALGPRYLADVKALAPPTGRITEKMPADFLFVGLIHLALPNARIIHAHAILLPPASPTPRNCSRASGLPISPSVPFARPAWGYACHEVWRWRVEVSQRLPSQPQRVAASNAAFEAAISLHPQGTFLAPSKCTRRSLSRFAITSMLCTIWGCSAYSNDSWKRPPRRFATCPMRASRRLCWKR